LKKKIVLFFVGFEVIKIAFKRDFSQNKTRFVFTSYFACFYIKVVLFGLFPEDVLFLSIRKSGLKWAYGGLILGTSPRHLRLNYSFQLKKNRVCLSVIQRQVQNYFRSFPVVGWLVKMWCSIFFEDCPFRWVLFYCKRSGQSSRKMSIGSRRLSAQSMSVSLFFNFCAQKTSKERRQPL
jgi:hypothetical protein